MHLWYFTSPSASISDALAAYEEAFAQGDQIYGVYAARPCPSELSKFSLLYFSHFIKMLKIFIRAHIQ